MSALVMAQLTPEFTRNLFNFVKRIVHDPAAAEEIAADSITRGLERIERDRPQSLRSWFFSIARNMAYHWRRDAQNRERLIARAPIRASRSAFQETVAGESMGALEAAIQRLTKSQRRVLLLRTVDRLSYDEVAALMKLTPGACRILLYRARANLRKWYPNLKRG